MRSSTKLKKILDSNTVAFSFGSNGWSITVIDFINKKRTQFSGKTFSEVVSNAYKNVNSEQKHKQNPAR
jgi:flagellar hook-basal body complex protein FliE